ncbi:MAG: hypothetical protein JJE34_05105 [Alphaproteobacteria bacterium]|nr:hypothetical protein [Alphaproteobacteria bacterium]
MMASIFFISVFIPQIAERRLQAGCRLRKFSRLARADRTFLHNQLTCQFANRQKSIGNFGIFVDSARIEGSSGHGCTIIGQCEAVFGAGILLRRKVGGETRAIILRGADVFTITVNGNA